MFPRRTKLSFSPFLKHCQILKSPPTPSDVPEKDQIVISSFPEALPDTQAATYSKSDVPEKDQISIFSFPEALPDTQAATYSKSDVPEKDQDCHLLLS
ncbi:hypothetical protein GE061_003069 [Apolygus lucorum]|uniref:Uncharacterized protein n=1 Tax=Apolygus lucorum TaxID=248454 RepID=A0A8S9X2H1_APOLU|nr:hypothetical protein GE061_003069 [Apolygus lucorum]